MTKRNWKKEFKNLMFCHALIIAQAKSITKQKSKSKAMKLLKEIASTHKSWKIKRN